MVTTPTINQTDAYLDGIKVGQGCLVQKTTQIEMLTYSDALNSEFVTVPSETTGEIYISCEKIPEISLISQYRPNHNKQLLFSGYKYNYDGSIVVVQDVPVFIQSITCYSLTNVVIKIKQIYPAYQRIKPKTFKERCVALGQKILQKMRGK